MKKAGAPNDDKTIYDKIFEDRYSGEGVKKCPAYTKKSGVDLDVKREEWWK